MTAAGQPGRGRLAWTMAVGSALAALALGYALAPEWQVPVPRPRPAAPRIVLIGSDQALPDARELRDVRSPALFALARGAAPPGGARTLAPAVSPPAGPPLATPPGLGMPRLACDVSTAPVAGRDIRPWDIPGIGVMSEALAAPVFRNDPGAGAGAVRVEYAGGLQGKAIAVDGWSWNPWTRSGSSWTIGLDIESDSDGRIIRALIETPAADGSLNEALVQSLYQRGRVRPAGACRGTVSASFPGSK